jgi:tetratricopeptide (TPR) repeat protein
MVPSTGRGLPTKVSSLIQRGLALVTPERNRQEAEAYCGWGCASLLLGQQQLPKAIQYFTQAIQDDPDYALAYYGRALAYRHVGQYQEALQDFRRAFSLEPHYIEAYYNREGFADDALMTKPPQDQKVYLDDYEPYCPPDGQWQQEIQALTKAISGARGRCLPFAYYSRALAYRHCGQWQEALQDFERAVELDPTIPYQPNGMSTSYYHQAGPYEFASKEALLKEYYDQGYQNFRRHDWEEAIQSFTYAIGLENWAAYGQGNMPNWDVYGYGRLYSIPGGEAYYRRGLAHSLLGQWEQARQDFSEVIRRIPLHADAYYCRAIAHRYLGQWEQAYKDEQHADVLEQKRVELKHAPDCSSRLGLRYLEATLQGAPRHHDLRTATL